MPTNTISEPGRFYSQPEATLWDPSPPDFGPRHSRLSSAQKSTQPLAPRVLIAKNGNWMKLELPRQRQDEGAKVVRGNRAAVTEFSRRSRKAFLDMVNKLDRQKLAIECGYFGTLTYPKSFPGPKVAKLHLKRFLQRFERAWGRRWVIWKLEPQPRRLAPHFHLLWFGDSQHTLQGLIDWCARTWYEIAGDKDPNHLRVHLGIAGGNNRPCVEKVGRWEAVRSYAGKTGEYLAKMVTPAQEGEWEHPGRWWGCKCRDLLPITVEEYELEALEFKLARRAMIRCYEHQYNGRARVTWSHEGRPPSVYRDFYDEDFLASALANGAQVMRYRRRRRFKGVMSGASMYVRDTMANRLLDWARAEARRRVGVAGSGTAPRHPRPSVDVGRVVSLRSLSP